MLGNQNFWMMTYGEDLRKALQELPDCTEKFHYLHSFGRMGQYLSNPDVDKNITFGKFYHLIDKNKY